jgi:hypothetical protein
MVRTWLGKECPDVGVKRLAYARGQKGYWVTRQDKVDGWVKALLPVSATLSATPATQPTTTTGGSSATGSSMVQPPPPSSTPLPHPPAPTAKVHVDSAASSLTPTPPPPQPSSSHASLGAGISLANFFFNAGDDVLHFELTQTAQPSGNCSLVGQLSSGDFLVLHSGCADHVYTAVGHSIGDTIVSFRDALMYLICRACARLQCFL